MLFTSLVFSRRQRRLGNDRIVQRAYALDGDVDRIDHATFHFAGHPASARTRSNFCSARIRLGLGWSGKLDAQAV